MPYFSLSLCCDEWLFNASNDISRGLLPAQDVTKTCY
jgi:hypothetical protein